MSLKISIGSKIIDGPFGGGNEYLKNLINYLKKNGYSVINHLKDNDIDVILLTNPLKTSQTSTFNNFDIDYYLKFKNPNALVFQRINECDERKNTNFINKAIVKSNKVVDVNLYVSSWMKTIYEQYDDMNKLSYVILGGPNKEIFNSLDKKYWNKKNKLKIVTHHWSNNYLKGFDYYISLDKLLTNTNLKNKFEFSYIGNIPKNIKFKSTKVYKPISGKPLGDLLKTFDIYITASRNEPSGNHHMEAALSGLPILYINSGALKEYCEGYGVEMKSSQNIEHYLFEIVKNFDDYIQKLKDYPFDFDSSAIKIEKAIMDTYKNKKQIIELRESSYRVKIFFVYYINRLYLNFYKIFRNSRKLLGKLKNYEK